MCLGRRRRLPDGSLGSCHPICGTASHGLSSRERHVRRNRTAPSSQSSHPRAGAFQSLMKLNFGNEPGKHTMPGKLYASEGIIRDSLFPYLSRVSRAIIRSVHQQTTKENSRIFLSVTHLIYARWSLAHFYNTLYPIPDRGYLLLRTASIRYLGIVYRVSGTFFLFL